MLQLIDINLVNKRLTQSSNTKTIKFHVVYAFKTFRSYILRLINKLNKNVYNNVVVNFVNSFDDRFYLYFKQKPIIQFTFTPTTAKATVTTNYRMNVKQQHVKI